MNIVEGNETNIKINNMITGSDCVKFLTFGLILVGQPKMSLCPYGRRDKNVENIAEDRLARQVTKSSQIF
jgi:hypothetical protein